MGAANVMANHTQSPVVLRIAFAFAKARTWFVSLCLHLILVIVAGTAVYTQVQESAPDFEAGTDGLLSTEPLPLSVPVEEVPKSPVVEVTNNATPVPQMSVVTTSASATMNVHTSVTPVTGIGASSLGGSDLMKGIGKNLVSVGGGRMGAGSYFGTKERGVDGLIGNFYDLKQDKNRKETGITPEEYHEVFRKFVSAGWKESILEKYFRSPRPLATTQIMIPNMAATEGPKAFEMEQEVKPSRWLVHYKGKVSPPEDGTYHFVGAGDDVLVVRFNGKVVLDRCWYQGHSDWKPERNYDYGWTGIPNGFAKGDPIQVRAGQYYDIEVLIGEQPGGRFFSCLLIEKDGEKYSLDGHGNPILPIFRLGHMPMPELENGLTLPPYAADGPVWKSARNTFAGWR